MEKRITLRLLATLFLANVSLADAQQTGKIAQLINLLGTQRLKDCIP